MQTLNIRKATIDDCQTIMAFIRELAEYEKAPEAVAVTPEEIQRDGFLTTPAKFEVFIAEVNGQPAGMALYYYAYSTWKGRILYLDDLYVRESYRRSGVGKALLTRIVNLAKEKKLRQVRFHVLNWNTTAIEFYKKYFDVKMEPEWVTFKIDLI